MFSCVWDLKIYHILYNVFHIWRTVRRSGRLCCEASWSTQQIWGHARPDNWHVIWNVESSKNIWHCHGLCESLGTTGRQNHINFLGATQCACSPPSPPSTQSLFSSFRWLWTHNDVIDFFTKFVHSQPPPPHPTSTQMFVQLSMVINIASHWLHTHTALLQVEISLSDL